MSTDDIHNAIKNLIEADRDVSARAVAQQLGVAPSTVTRSEERMNLVKEGQNTQASLRSIMMQSDKISKSNIVRKLAEKDHKINQLEEQVNILIASHKAMLLAIGEMGGTDAWRRFFLNNSKAFEKLRTLGAIPLQKCTGLTDIKDRDES